MVPTARLESRPDLRVSVLLGLGLGLGLALACLGVSREAGATVVLNSAIVSPDITVDLSGTTLDDQLVGDDDLSGTVVAVTIGPLADATDVNAYYLESGTSDELFSLDVTADLGGLIAYPGDVVRFDGAIYTLKFDASAEGVPDGTMTDAVAIVGSDLLLSFDTTVTLAGNTYDDEDLVRFDGSAFTLFFDGSAQGVASGLDLDAAHYFESVSLLALSFDGSGALGGVVFDDEDVLEYDAGSGSWSITYDGSAQHTGWHGSDLDAVHLVPEPGGFVGLACGVGLLSLIGRRRAR